MIHDPTIDITCDKCDNEIVFEPEFKFRDYSGKNGEYDCSTRAIEEWLETQNWVSNDDEHYCEDCTEDDDE